MRAEILWRTLPRLRARAQLGDSMALESRLSTAFQGAPTSQQAASTLCSSRVPGRRFPAATSTRPPAGGRGALPGAVARLPPAEIRLPPAKIRAPSAAGPRTVTAPARQARRRPRLRVPTPWSRPLKGRLANRSPGTQAGAEPERAGVPQKCERVGVGLNRWMANGSARVRDARGGGTGPGLESRSQLP